MLAHTSSSAAATKFKARALIALDNYEYAGRDLKKGDRFLVEDEEHAKLLTLAGRAKPDESEEPSAAPSSISSSPAEALRNAAAASLAAPALVAQQQRSGKRGNGKRNK